MIPPKGFKQELYPLRHRVEYSFGLSARSTTMNSAFATLVRHSTDLGTNVPAIVVVNPHNTAYVEETGAIVTKMSILDKLSLSIKFNLTDTCNVGETASGVFGDGISAVNLLWRPVFFSFPEKLQAADDDTGNTVETILALTSDDANQDVVPLTTNKLPIIGASDFPQPVSTVNKVEVFGDYNMTSNTTMEDHVWDEDLFQNALRRFTNKGALKACIGRTRHLTLTPNRPFKNYYIKKFVPRAIRRVVDRTFMGIQIHIPTEGDPEQYYYATQLTAALAHVGVAIKCHYHEWNSDHFQDMNGIAPIPV